MLENFVSRLPSYIISLPVILLALSVHEAAHGYVAYKLGDPTARNLGRITLNPLKHLNPIGFLMMLFFHVGFANPVPINSRNFKNPRRGMALVAIAGPLTNLLLGIASLLCSVGLYSLSWAVAQANLPQFLGMAITWGALFFDIAFMINVGLAVFNLLPIPPLDGSRIAALLLPPRLYFKIMRYERQIAIGLMVLLLIDSYVGPHLLQRLLNLIVMGPTYLVGMIPCFSWGVELMMLVRYYI
jgi:Zn-dependent protease